MAGHEDQGPQSHDQADDGVEEEGAAESEPEEEVGEEFDGREVADAKEGLGDSHRKNPRAEKRESCLKYCMF